MPTLEAAGSNTKGISERALNGYYLENTVDMTDFTVASTDVIEMINVPLGFIVTGGVLKCEVVGSTNANGQIGITSGDTNGFLTVQDLDGLSIGDIVPFDGAYLAAITGRHFVAADTIDMLLDTAADAIGKWTIRIWGHQAPS